MPEIIETDEQFMNVKVSTRMLKSMAKAKEKRSRVRTKQITRERIEAERSDRNYKVRCEMREQWKLQAKAIIAADPDCGYSIHELMEIIAKQYGADQDDAKFWSSNCTPFNFILKAIRYELFFSKVRKAKGL